jgi:hypothetical protein
MEKIIREIFFNILDTVVTVPKMEWTKNKVDKRYRLKTLLHRKYVKKE